MKKKRFLIVEELDPASLTDLPELQKKHYKQLGYRPYRMGNGKVKWLTEVGKAYTKSRAVRRRKSNLKNIPQTSYGEVRRKRRYRRNIFTFLSEYWPFIAMAIIILIVLFLYMR